MSAGLSYVVLVGGFPRSLAEDDEAAGDPRDAPCRGVANDRFAGFLLGIAKGGLVAAFLVAGLEKYGLKQIEMIPWAHEQARSSHALVWNGQYRPASRVWESVPVRHFVYQFQRMGLEGSASSPSTDATKDGDRPVVQTARRGPTEGSSEAVSSTRRPRPESPPPSAGRF